MGKQREKERIGPPDARVHRTLTIEQIVEARRRGEKIESIALRANLSSSRISQILWDAAEAEGDEK